MHIRNALKKHSYLRKLIDSANTDDQKYQLKQITDVIKLMYKKFKFDFRDLNFLFMTFVKDSFQMSNKAPALIITDQFESLFKTHMKF